MADFFMAGWKTVGWTVIGGDCVYVDSQVVRKGVLWYKGKFIFISIILTFIVTSGRVLVAVCCDWLSGGIGGGVTLRNGIPILS